MEVAKISLRPSVALGALVGFTVAFFMNKYWSFKNGEKKVFRQYSYFIALYSVSFFIGVGLTVYLTETMNLWYLFSRLVAIMLGGLLNYMWLHHIVFSNKLPKRSFEDSL
jgi:putative flippase GtrA